MSKLAEEDMAMELEFPAFLDKVLDASVADATKTEVLEQFKEMNLKGPKEVVGLEPQDFEWLAPTWGTMSFVARAALKNTVAAANLLAQTTSSASSSRGTKRELSEEDSMVVDQGGTLAPMPTAAPAGGIAGTGIGASSIHISSQERGALSVDDLVQAKEQREEFRKKFIDNVAKRVGGGHAELIAELKRMLTCPYQTLRSPYAPHGRCIRCGKKFVEESDMCTCILAIKAYLRQMDELSDDSD